MGLPDGAPFFYALISIVALSIASENISDALHRGVAVHLGDRSGEGNVFGAYSNAILGIAAAGYAIGSHDRAQTFLLVQLAGGVGIEQTDLGNGGRSDELVCMPGIRAGFEAAAAGHAARQLIGPALGVRRHAWPWS